MNKLIIIWLSVGLFISTSLCAQETFTISTYYPAPFGIYRQVISGTLGVGDNDGSGGIDASDAPNPATNSGDVWISGNTGIGTTTARSRLDVSGAAIIGANLAGNAAVTAPTNGLLVEGDVGFGLTNPNFTAGTDVVVNNTLRLTPGPIPTPNTGVTSLRGALYYSAADNRLMYHDGNTWKYIGGIQWGDTTVDLRPKEKNKANTDYRDKDRRVECPDGYAVVEVFIDTHEVCKRYNNCNAIEIERMGIRCRRLVP